MASLRRPTVVFPSAARLALVLGLLLAITGCGSQASSPSAPGDSAEPGASEPGGELVSGGTLTVGTSQEVLTLDLPNFRSTQDIMTAGLIVEPLVFADENMEIHPLLAESWEQVDGVTYTFQLRQGVTFQDGEPFNAEAVKTFFDRAIEQTQTPEFYGAVDSISTSGEYEVTFHLTQPYSPFLNNLAFPVGGIQSPASLEGSEEEIARNPVGTGPFQLADWTGTTITLERNDGYWGEPALLDEVVLEFFIDDATRLAALRAGEVDAIQNPAPLEVADLDASDEFQIFSGPRAQQYFLAMNHENPVLQDERVRRAIAMAIDKSQIVDAINEGLAREATGFTPPELVDMGTTPIAYDPDGARELLEEAYPDGLPELRLLTPIGVVPLDVEMTENIQAQLAEVGIETELVTVEYAAYFEQMAAHDYDISGLAWSFSPAPAAWYFAVFDSEAGSTNWSAYSNPEADALIEDATLAESYDDAVEIWTELDQLLVDDVAGVPLYWATYLWAASERVHDFGYHPLNILQLTSTWIEP